MQIRRVPELNGHEQRAFFFTTSTFSARENQSAPSAALHVTSYEVIYAVTRVTINVFFNTHDIF